MKSIHNSEGKEANHIEYQPIIDGDPNDHNNLHSTSSMHWERKAKHFCDNVWSSFMAEISWHNP